MKQFRSRKFRCRRAHLLLGAALLLGQAQGQATAGCGTSEELLGVSVGRSDRGTQVVKLALEGKQVSVLVPEGVLRAAEAGLIASRVDCEGEAYVTLAPDVQVRYDPSAQTLFIAPVLARLGSQTLDFRTTPPTAGSVPEPAAPAWGVSYGARMDAAYSLRGAPAGEPDKPLTWSGDAYLGVGAALGRASGYVGALVERGVDGAASVSPRALVRYAVGPDLVVYGAWNASPLVSEPSFGTSDFRGVAVAGRGGFGRVLPEFKAELPLEADVEVRVNGKLLRSFRAGAGTLRLLNLPLPSGDAAVSVYLSDETGEQEFKLQVSAQPALPPGAYLYSAQGGWLAGGWRAQASAQVGLTRGWSLLGQGQVTAEAFGVQARAQYVGTPWNLALSAAVLGGKDAAGVRTVHSELAASAARSFGALGLTGMVTLPLGAPRDATFGLTAGYNTRAWLLSVDARSGLRAQTWRLGAAATYFPDKRSSVTTSVQAQPGSWRAGLTVAFSPTPRWQLGAQAESGSSGLNGSARVRFAPDPSQSVDLTVSKDDLELAYNLTRAARVQVTVSTRAAAAEVTGAASFVGGVLKLRPELAQRAVLVRTGLPNIPLLLGGEAVGLTDARGELLITRLPLGEVIGLRVDLKALPFGIAVQEVERQIVPPLNGVLTVNWRENFKVFRFVQFFWKTGEPAAYGEVTVGGEKVLLDDEGYGLTPSAPVATPGELRSEDGARRCPVSVLPAAETVTCAGG